MSIKLIAVDIDGTLLNSNHQISERTKNKIQELYQSDIPFVLVSARMPKGMSYFLDELKIKEPMVCYSGGLILDENKEVIYSKGFSVEMAKRLFEYIKYYYQVPVSFYIEDRWMVEEIYITGLKPEKLDLNGVKKVHKLLIIADKNIIDQLEMCLKEKFTGLKIYKSKDTYLEIMDESVTKASAIQFLCDKMKISLHQVISFGDNYNDLDMLLLTGKGFAMANGAKGVLESISTHTLSNDEDGIVYALENLVGE